MKRILLLLLVLSLPGCATFEANIIKAGNVLTEVRETVHGLCARGAIAAEDCRRIKHVYNSTLANIPEWK